MLARPRSLASLSMEFTCPCAGKGKIRTWAVGHCSMINFRFLDSLNIVTSFCDPPIDTACGLSDFYFL